MHSRTTMMTLPFLYVLGAQGAAADAPANVTDANAYCESISSIARSIAEAKANGSPKEQLITLTNNQSGKTALTGLRGISALSSSNRSTPPRPTLRRSN